VRSLDVQKIRVSGLRDCWATGFVDGVSKSEWNVQRSGRPRRPNRDEEIYMVLNHERNLGKGGDELMRASGTEVKRKHKVV
jgi:hypothetical protein